MHKNEEIVLEKGRAFWHLPWSANDTCSCFDESFRLRLTSVPKSPPLLHGKGMEPEIKEGTFWAETQGTPLTPSSRWTDKVKTLPSRRTSYEGGNNQNVVIEVSCNGG